MQPRAHFSRWCCRWRRRPLDRLRALEVRRADRGWTGLLVAVGSMADANQKSDATCLPVD